MALPKSATLATLLEAIQEGKRGKVHKALMHAGELSGDDAVAALQAAHCADMKQGKFTAASLEFGVVQDVFRGIRKAQERVCTTAEICDHDNAVTALACTAARGDDIVLLEALLNWEPNFAMRRGEPGDEEGDRGLALETALFFEDLSAPKCARFCRHYHNDGVLTHMEQAALEKFEAKIRRVAKVYIRKLKLRAKTSESDSPEIAMRRSMLHELLRSGQVGVSCVATGEGDSIFTTGLCLLGAPELLAMTKKGDNVEEMQRRMHVTVRSALLGTPPNDVETQRVHSGTLSSLIAPFSELRTTHSVAILIIRL